MNRIAIVIGATLLASVWSVSHYGQQPTFSNASAAAAVGVEQNMNVSRAAITRLNRGRFRITASGSAPTPGWATRLSPVTYVRQPENWLIQAVGAGPDTPVIQVLSKWNSSVVLGLGPQTKQVTIQGAGAPIVLSVPHRGRPTRTAVAATTQ